MVTRQDGRIHPSLGSPGDEVVYVPRPLYEHDQNNDHVEDVEIVVSVPGADIPNIFAHRQWRAGMLLADLIYTQTIDLRQKVVLELGAGTGLPSIAASRFGRAGFVVCTDYDSPSLVKTLRENVTRNTSSSKDVRVAGHTWAQAIDDVEDLVPSPRARFDCILLADCIWDDLSHTDLIRSVTRLLDDSAQSRVYMVSGLHTGREKIISFLRRARKAGLTLCEMPQVRQCQLSQDWPTLDEEETKVGLQEAEHYSEDDALQNASRYIMEMQIADRTAEEEERVVRQGQLVFRSAKARLSGKRRTFVVQQRPEEDKERGGIHERNRWITFLSLRRA